ncbi:50S ribosomal protein L4 [Candidatus Parcubacteria bacterium]|nr:50S ribosomal protein L4 [Candidatus Parcubacteria bacterium]
MELPVYNHNAEKVDQITVSDSVFGVPMNKDLLHQIVTAQLANKRQVIAHTKGRSEVRGGGKKPWAQKGTGRARHGSTRSPIWRGGGVTFGPSKEKNFKKKINKKMLQKALKVALSSKTRDGQLIVIDSFELNQPKTKEVATMLKHFSSVFGKPSSVLMVSPTNGAIVRAARNLPNVDVVQAAEVSPLMVLSSTFILVPKEAVQIIESKWIKSAKS